MNNETIQLKGIIEIKQFRNGKLIDKRKVNNVITNAGKAEIANLAGSVSSPDAFDYLAVGTDNTAAAASQTALGAEITDSGLARAASTNSRVTTTVANDTLQLLKSFAVTGTKAVVEAGAFNASSAGIMLGRQVFSALNVINGDVLQIVYKFIFA